MTEFAHDNWVEGVVQQCARSNLVRVQLGAAYPHARTALTNRIGAEVDAAAYLEEAANSRGMRLVTNVEALIAGAPLSLGRLRDRVNADRDNGAQIVLVSRLPKIGYPDVPGSSVLRDAKPIAPPLYTSDNDSNFVFGLEVTSSGTPADIVLAQAFRELGEAACASLDAFLFERGDDAQRLDSLEEPVVDALFTAGLATIVEGKLVWALTEPRERARRALAEVIASMRHPQKEFPSVAEHSWAIERLVKQALRARAVTLWGRNWKNELIPGDSHRVILSRANIATYDPAEALDQLRDPLEWMTLAETLDVRGTGDAGSLGLPEGMWTHFAAEMLPVKDRIDRSQLLRKHDADTARKWAQVLRQKLSTTGSPDPTTGIGSAPVSQRDLLKGLRASLLENPHVQGDVEKDILALVLATVRFLAHTSDTSMDFTEEFSDRADAPKERALQDSFKAFLDAGDLSGRSAVEVESVGTGRADVVLYMNDGARYVTEVKRHFSRSSRDRLEDAYLAQALAYQAANVPFSQLLILDLSPNRAAHEDHLTNSVWVTHKRDGEEAVVASTLVAVVRGNRPAPSQRKI